MKINTGILTADDEFESLFCAPAATTQVPVSAPVGLAMKVFRFTPGHLLLPG